MVCRGFTGGKNKVITKLTGGILLVNKAVKAISTSIVSAERNRELWASICM